ncbi:SDR family NAD(P)-dependent oxidoreductase [Gordonia sp. FQ]|uniref:SDR family NAD(P)-dependent oxidoreductase n=1 Tax=Gordonia sp. FQ TaxID=3446634 RepID=UPI003F855777
MEADTKRGAVVLGGSRGIGLAAARALAGAGSDVVIGYRSDHAAADEAADSIAAESGRRVRSVCADLADIARTREAIGAAAQWLGGTIDVLCIPAGIEHLEHIDEATPEIYDTVFGTNTRGVYFAIQSALPFIPDGGRIVCLSSISASTPFANHAIYSASKAAVEAFVGCLAVDLAARSITVNAVAPGGTHTGLALDTAQRFGAHLDPRMFHLPFGRLAEPAEIASVIEFLASPAAGWITGQTIRVAGGQ